MDLLCVYLQRVVEDVPPPPPPPATARHGARTGLRPLEHWPPGSSDSQSRLRKQRLWAWEC